MIFKLQFMIDLTLKEANILVVDDQKANLDVLEGFLEMQGYTNIKTTQDPRVVLPLFESFQPDLILLDLSMPYLSGFEIMEQINALMLPQSYLPVLVLTADVTSESKQRALSGGASDFLTKPFDLVEVGLRIRNLLFTSYLQQQLRNQKQVLEDKVRERTAELQIAKEKAEAGEKLKTSFINNISHEIRTPLNGILGFGNILMDSSLSDSEKEDYYIMFNESCFRLISTVTNFLDIAKINSRNQDINYQDVDLLKLINETIAQFEPVCNLKSIRIRVSFQVPDNDIILRTDGELLRKIIGQLLDNAVKFTKSGTVTILVSKTQEFMKFIINDTGIGISKENQTRIFESFIQENASSTRGYEGSGLGLSIVKGFLNILGGEIWLDSVKGVGTTVNFTLPVSFEQTNRYIETITNSEETKRERLTILVAEDDDINFEFMKALLKNELIDIIHAPNGEEAVAVCKENVGIDLILMDIKMPVMDGIEATRKIKAFRGSLPIIAITSYSESEVRLEAELAGCDDFISKPFTKDILYSKIKELGMFPG